MFNKTALLAEDGFPKIWLKNCSVGDLVYFHIYGKIFVNVFLIMYKIGFARPAIAAEIRGNALWLLPVPVVYGHYLRQVISLKFLLSLLSKYH